MEWPSNGSENLLPKAASLRLLTGAHCVDSCNFGMSNHLLKIPLLTGCKARLAAYSEVLVLDWTGKGQTGPRQRSCEGSAEAEDRDGEDLVRVPQVSGSGWKLACPISPQHRHLLFQMQPEKGPVRLLNCCNHEEEDRTSSSSLRRSQGS